MGEIHNRRVMLQTLLLVLLTVAMNGCGEPAAQVPTSPPPSVPQAWIDGPMDGSNIPFEPYEVIFHVGDAGGVAGGELSINGQLAANIPVPSAGTPLATLRYMWSMPSPGVYTLQARAQNAAGAWSDFVTARVTVGEPTITPSPTPVITITPTLTPTPTATLTPTPTLTSTSAPLSFAARISTDQIYNGSCGTDSVVISAQLTNYELVNNVDLFIHLEDQASSTGWYDYGMMSSKGSGLFQTNVKASNIEGADDFDTARVVYQFVAVGGGGAILGRSGNYYDITLNKCSSGPVRRDIITVEPFVPVRPTPVEPIATYIIIK